MPLLLFLEACKSFLILLSSNSFSICSLIYSSDKSSCGTTTGLVSTFTVLTVFFTTESLFYFLKVEGRNGLVKADCFLLDGLN